MMPPHMNAIAQMYPHIAFHKFLGIEILEIAEDFARVELPFRPELVGGADAYHGGVVASLIDLTGALAAWSGHAPKPGERAATVSITVQYIAEARATARRKELIFCDVSARAKEDDRLIATGTLVYRIA